MGKRGLILATLPAMAFGAGYVAGGALGVRARWSRRHHDEAWVIIGLAILGLGNSSPTPAGGVTAPIVVFKSYQAMLDQPAGSLTGKIAVVTQAMGRTQDGSSYGAVGIQRARHAVPCALLAELAGVVAAIVVCYQFFG